MKKGRVELKKPSPRHSLHLSFKRFVGWRRALNGAVGSVATCTQAQASKAACENVKVEDRRYLVSTAIQTELVPLATGPGGIKDISGGGRIFGICPGRDSGQYV